MLVPSRHQNETIALPGITATTSAAADNKSCFRIAIVAFPPVVICREHVLAGRQPDCFLTAG